MRDTSVARRLLATDHEATLARHGELMPDTGQITLPPDEAHAAIGALEGGPAARLSSATRDALAEAVDAFGPRVFVRANLASFKEPGVPSTALRSVGQIEALMSRPNPRAAALLRRAVEGRLGASLFVSTWHDIPPWAEARLFLYQGQLIGASQYHHHETFPEIAPRAVEIAASLRRLADALIPVLAAPSVVADTFVAPGPAGLEVHLVELNPFDFATDPCLYRWSRGGDFDFAYRYRAADGAIAKEGGA